MADDDDSDPVRAERERELQKFNAPYVYQEYTRMLYRAATDSSGRIENRTVQNAAEEQQAQAAGWLRRLDEAVAVEQARQEAIAAARKAQETRELEDVFRRVLDERERRQKERTSIPPIGQVLDDRTPLTLPQAAKRLGMSVSTLKRAAKRGVIRVLILGPKTHRVSAAEVDRALTSPEFQKYQFPDRDH